MGGRSKELQRQCLIAEKKQDICKMPTGGQVSGVQRGLGERRLERQTRAKLDMLSEVMANVYFGSSRCIVLVLMLKPKAQAGNGKTIAGAKHRRLEHVHMHSIGKNEHMCI